MIAKVSQNEILRLCLRMTKDRLAMRGNTDIEIARARVRARATARATARVIARAMAKLDQT